VSHVIGSAVKSRRPTNLSVILLLAAAVLFCAHAWTYREWTEDDAFISFRYAKNLADGQGLVFNPGERVEAYSNFSWVLLQSAALKAGLDPETASKALGLLAGLAALVFSWLLARRLLPEAGAAAAAAPLLVAASPLLTRHAVSGLETALFALLVVLALWLAAGGRGVGTRAGLVAAGLGLVFTRPEGIGVALLFVLGHALFAGGARGDGGARSARYAAIVDATVLVLVFVAYSAWRRAYFGAFLPNTFHAKMGGGLEGIAYGAYHVLNWLRDTNALPLLGLSLVPLVVGGTGRVYRLCLALLGAYGAFIVASGGDWMYHYRFFAHLLPVLCALAAAGLGLILAQPVAGGRAFRLVAVTLLILSLGILSEANQERAVARRVLPALRSHDYLTQNYEELGLWLRENTSPDASVAASDVGALAYYSERRVLDMYGLTDPHIARLPGVHHRNVDPDYVLERRPDYVILISRPDRHLSRTFQRLPDARLHERAAFHERYEPVHERPLGYQNETALVFRLRS